MAFPGDYQLLRKIPLDATAITGSNNAYTGLITETAFKLSKTFIFANTDNGGGDVRLSTDEAGLNQIAIDIPTGGWNTSGETCQLWYLADGVDDSSPTDLYIWGDNTGDSQPAVGAAFGRNAVWAALEYSSHDGVTDSTGNGTITQFGSPTVGTSKWGGNSVICNGSDQYGRLSGSYPNTNTRSLSVWIKSNSTQFGTPFGMFLSSDSNNYERIAIDSDGFANGLRRIGSSTSNNTQGSTDITDNTWHNIDFVIETGTIKHLYVDGVLVDTNSNSFQNQITLNRITYGASDDSSMSAFFDGELAGMLLYESANDADFIATKYSNQNDVAGFYLEPVSPGGGGITVTPDTVTTSSVSLNPTIAFNSLLELTPTTVNSSSISLDPVIAFQSLLTLTPDVVNSSSISLNPTIIFSGTLELNPDTVNSISVSLDPVIQFSSSLNLLPGTVDSLSVALNPVIEFTSALVINPDTVNSSSISLNPLIEFKSVINLTPETVNTLSVSLNPIITTGEQQIIGTVTAGFKDDEISVKYKISGITVNFKE